MKHLESFNDEKYPWYKECVKIIDMSIRLEDIISELHFDYKVGYLTDKGSASYPLFYDRKTDELLGDADHVNHAIRVYAKLCVCIDIYLSEKYTPFKHVGDVSFGSENSDLLIKILSETNSIYSNIKNSYSRYTVFRDGYISVCFLKNKK